MVSRGASSWAAQGQGETKWIVGQAAREGTHDLVADTTAAGPATAAYYEAGRICRIKIAGIERIGEGDLGAGNRGRHGCDAGEVEAQRHQLRRSAQGRMVEG